MILVSTLFESLITSRWTTSANLSSSKSPQETFLSLYVCLCPTKHFTFINQRHGRIAQLAIVGYIAVDLGIVVHPLGQGLSSAAAHDVLVEKGVMGNALIWICAFEIVSYLAVAEMLQGSGRAPGDFGLGVGFLKGKSEAQIEKLKYQEIMNGRLAMMAFGGAVTQSVLYNSGFPYAG